MAYWNFKNLNRRTVADNILLDKAFNSVKNPKYNGYQRGFLSMVYTFFDKKFMVIENENISSKQLPEKLHKHSCFKSTLTFYTFIDNFCASDLANMPLISKFN